MSAGPNWSAADFDPSKIGRFCDVVMKGGVTSGVVYPPALCHLASKFILRNIGGTSVGAIAAVLAAAAEFRRRSSLASDEISSGCGGYVALSKVPAFLNQDGAMLRLFAADPTAAGLLRVALCFVGKGSFWAKLGSVIEAVITQRRYALTALLVVAGFGLIFYAFARGNLGIGAFGLILGAVVGAIVLLLLFMWDCIVALATNDFGWCHAFDSDAAGGFQKTLDTLPTGLDVTNLTAEQTPRLFDWLDALVANTAGLPRNRPLTFGDLATATLPPWYARGPGETGIGFRVMTTCVTLGRPFALPFDDEAVRMLSPGAPTNGRGLFFDPLDFAKYFPQHVVDHMVAKTRPVPYKTTAGHQLYAFPANQDLPIIVAVRMSMSFPVLFCAIRLYGLYARDVVKPIWFSDGGLSSNFPTQFFDSALPRWPTFALDLLGGGTGKVEQDVFLEIDDPVRANDVWSSLEETKPLARLLAFGSAILDAMRTWHDTTQSSLPGNLSRMIGVCLPPDEGGINLKMSADQINNLAALGEQAGLTLDAEFGSAPDTDAWRRQRWYRYLATMNAAAGWLGEFQRGYAPFASAPAQQTYASMIQGNYQSSESANAVYPRTCLLPSCEIAASAKLATEKIAQSCPETLAECLSEAAPTPTAELRVSPP